LFLVENKIEKNFALYVLFELVGFQCLTETYKNIIS